MVNEKAVKKTFLVTDEQDRRLKSFCKLNKISASQLLRLFIDDLYMHQYDNTRSSIETTGFKVQNFVGAFDHEPAKKAVLSDDAGNHQARWFKKFKHFNSFF